MESSGMINLEKIPGESARDYASRFLTKNIVSMELKPGTVLSENELAKEMGISRTPLREALIDLNRSLVVETIPQKGSFVSLIDPDLVEEARFIREVLDLSVIEIACHIATEEDILNLEANVKLQEFYLENRAPDKLMELDNEFHKQLFIAANMPHVHSFMGNITIHFDRVRHLSYQTVKEVKTVSAHRAILDAVLARDSQKAVALMRKHLGNYTVEKDELMSRYPQYFK